MTKEEQRKILGNNLVALLELKGKSRKDVSDALNTSYTKVCDWTKARTYPNQHDLGRLAFYFDTTIEQLTSANAVIKENGFDPLAFRFMCLNSHYRKQLVFSYDALTQAESTLKKLRNKIKSLSDSGELDRNLYKIYNNKFILEISNDLNTANAITVIYELLKDSYVSDKTKISLITSFDEVLSLNLISNEEENLENDAYIKEKIAERNEAKKNKNYVLADEIRDNLLKEGIKLIDTREGTIYEIIKD